MVLSLLIEYGFGLNWELCDSLSQLVLTLDCIERFISMQTFWGSVALVGNGHFR
jgi:hypothetical protein